jgi:hypothetical protein
MVLPFLAPILAVPAMAPLVLVILGIVCCLCAIPFIIGLSFFPILGICAMPSGLCAVALFIAAGGITIF